MGLMKVLKLHQNIFTLLTTNPNPKKDEKTPYLFVDIDYCSAS